MSYDNFFDHFDDRDITIDALKVEPFIETVRRHAGAVEGLGISHGLRNQIAGPAEPPSEGVISLMKYREREREPSTIADEFTLEAFIVRIRSHAA